MSEDELRLLKKQQENQFLIQRAKYPLKSLKENVRIACYLRDF